MEDSPGSLSRRDHSFSRSPSSPASLESSHNELIITPEPLDPRPLPHVPLARMAARSGPHPRMTCAMAPTFGMDAARGPEAPVATARRGALALRGPSGGCREAIQAGGSELRPGSDLGPGVGTSLIALCPNDSSRSRFRVPTFLSIYSEAKREVPSPRYQGEILGREVRTRNRSSRFPCVPTLPGGSGPAEGSEPGRNRSSRFPCVPTLPGGFGPAERAGTRRTRVRAAEDAGAPLDRRRAHDHRPAVGAMPRPHRWPKVGGPPRRRLTHAVVGACACDELVVKGRAMRAARQRGSTVRA